MILYDFNPMTTIHHFFGVFFVLIHLITENIFYFIFCESYQPIKPLQVKFLSSFLFTFTFQIRVKIDELKIVAKKVFQQNYQNRFLVSYG